MGDTRHRPRRRHGRARARAATHAAMLNDRRYRVAAVSAGDCALPDLILADGDGQTFLMMPTHRRIAPLDPANRDAIGLFYEPALDLSWHTLRELRRRYYNA